MIDISQYETLSYTDYPIGKDIFEEKEPEMIDSESAEDPLSSLENESPNQME